MRSTRSGSPNAGYPTSNRFVRRVVFTQPSVYGVDNSAIINDVAALNTELPGRARAVIACNLDISNQELADSDAAGVRGVRLTTGNKGGMPFGMDQIPELAARIAPFGWHVEFLFPGQDILDLIPTFEALTVPMSISHFAYQPAIAGVLAPSFQALVNVIPGLRLRVPVHPACIGPAN